MKKICVIGAGNIGSRHLQGLKKISSPLSIEVVDLSLDSIRTAQERWNQLETSTNHKISFMQDLAKVSKKIDLAIIATSSDVRRKVLEKLLFNSKIKYLILEKILFQKRKNYSDIEKLLEKKKIKTWVNFSMRTMPFYRDLKGRVEAPIQMIVSGSQYGLITNVIHFIDYIAYLTNCYDFKIVTDGLDHNLTGSKRTGFSELNGTLIVIFKDGSSGYFHCYPVGDAPFTIEIASSNYHCISKESERKSWISSSKDKWSWKEIDSNIPYQSDMTNLMVKTIFKKGICNLTPYHEASKLHLQLLESLLKFLNTFGNKLNLYPFT